MGILSFANTLRRAFLVAALSAGAALVSAQSDAGTSASPPSNASTAARTACRLLSAHFPQLVAFPGSAQFDADIDHWAVSSEQNATCSIQPRDAADVSAVLRVVGRADVRAPFAVKAGGHAYNQGHSSTPGVQISLARLAQLTHDPAAGTVTLGTGLAWDAVYERLEPLGVNVAGGRIPGIGVGGFSLGGGYSWKTNQVGLTIDTIAAFDLVLPAGASVHVTNASAPDLFFALKGGLNNFGIVTAITFEAHPQPLIWGGSITYTGDVIEQLSAAVAAFDLTNTDPKAQILVSYASIAGQFFAAAYLFYDAPAAPAGVFAGLLAVPAAAQQLGTQPFSAFIRDTFARGDLGIGPFKIAQHVIPIEKYTPPVLSAIVAEIRALSLSLSTLFPSTPIIVSIAPEPFLRPNAHSRGGAFPHPPARQTTPASPFIAYPAAAPLDHAVLVEAVRTMARNVQRAAVAAGQSSWDAPVYPNYALGDTPLELIYGANLPRLRQIARRYDPRGVMRLTGGFKLAV